MYTILICDDDRDIVSALDIYLTSEGYQTIKAYNGREAVRAAETHEIHLILMDVMMPELDGIRATAKLREGSNVPIILLTAKSEDTDKILGLNIGADDYITKPFNPGEIPAAAVHRPGRGGEGPWPHYRRAHRDGRRSQGGHCGRGAHQPYPHRVQYPQAAAVPPGSGVLFRPNL